MTVSPCGTTWSATQEIAKQHEDGCYRCKIVKLSARNNDLEMALRSVHGLATRQLAEPEACGTFVLLEICMEVENALPVDHRRTRGVV